MPSLFLPDPTVKPAAFALADPDHEHNQGCVEWFGLLEGSGNRTVGLINGTVGTLTNGPTWGPGAQGTVVGFDGTNDYVAASDARLPAGTAARSVSAWLRPTSTPPYFKTALSWGTDVANLGMYVGVWHAGPHLAVSQNGALVQGATALTLGAWVHLAMTYDGATYQLYLNGVPDGSGTMPTNTTLNGVLALGSDMAGAQNFVGSLDNLRLYNRALPASLISDLSARPWAGIMPSVVSRFYSLPSGVFFRRSLGMRAGSRGVQAG